MTIHLHLKLNKTHKLTNLLPRSAHLPSPSLLGRQGREASRVNEFNHLSNRASANRLFLAGVWVTNRAIASIYLCLVSGPAQGLPRSAHLCYP